MTSSTLETRVANATRRLAQLTARQLLRERRAALRTQAADRRSELQRRMKWGAAVIQAGMDDWEVAEVVGLLVEGKARLGTSTTQRLGLRKQGEAFLGINGQPTLSAKATAPGEESLQHVVGALPSLAS